MQSKALIFLCLTGLLLTFGACTKFSVIGSDLVEIDNLQVTFTDSIRPNTYNDRIDSLLIYDNPLSPNVLYVGKYQDPIAGKTESRSVFLILTSAFNFPRFKDPAQRLDSIVLVLPYSDENFYGKVTGLQQQLAVYRLEEEVAEDASLYSNKNWLTGMDPLAIANITPDTAWKGPAILERNDAGDVVDSIKIPHARINLTSAMQDFILNLDSAAWVNDSILTAQWKGFLLAPVNEGEGMYAFSPTNRYAKLNVYYTTYDTVQRQYDFIINSNNLAIPRSMQFVHEYAGTPFQSLISNDTAQVDSLLLVQGLSGMDARVDLPYQASLDNKAVNYALLEMTVAVLPGDDTTYLTRAPQLVAYEYVGTEKRFILDVSKTLMNGTSFLAAYFGGTPTQTTVEGKKYWKYRMNLSGVMQDVIRNKSSKKIYIGVYDPDVNPSRVVLYGAGSGALAPVLKLALTDVIL